MKLKSAAAIFVLMSNIDRNHLVKLASTVTLRAENFYTIIKRNREIILGSPSGPERAFGPYDLNTILDVNGNNPLGTAIALRDHKVAEQLIKQGGAELSQAKRSNSIISAFEDPDKKWGEYFKTRPVSEQREACERVIESVRSGARLLDVANIPVAKPLSSELQLELATICGNLKQIQQLLPTTEVTSKMIKLAVENLRPEALKQLLPLYKGNLHPARNLADKMAETPASEYARVKAIEMVGMICPTRLDYASKLQLERDNIGRAR